MYKTNLWFVRESVFMNEYSKPFQCVLVLAIYICYYSFQIMVSFELDSEKADCCKDYLQLLFPLYILCLSNCVYWSNIWLMYVCLWSLKVYIVQRSCYAILKAVKSLIYMYMQNNKIYLCYIFFIFNVLYLNIFSKLPSLSKDHITRSWRHCM